MTRLCAVVLISSCLLSACAKEGSPMDEQLGAEGKADGYDSQNQPVIPGVKMELRLAELPRSGTPEKEPWTGWWWPFDHKVNGEKDGIAYAWLAGEVSPAHKYDQAFGGGAGRVADWELDHHARGQSWYGHCDGWALASSATAEPMVSVLENGVCFHPHDIKALLTEAYECDMSGQDVTLLGVECFEDDPERDDSGRIVDDSCRDVNAGLFHLTLANMLGRERRAFFYDRQTSTEIWNYPLRSYESELGEPREPTAEERAHVARKTDKVVEVTTRIQYVRAEQPSLERAYVTTNDRYEYLLELDAAGRVIGGEWLGSSKGSHPDALKIPGADARPRKTPGACNNPHLDGERVMALAQRSASGTVPECTPAMP